MPRAKDIDVACPHCGGDAKPKVETDYGEVIEPSGGILVCSNCLHAVDPDAEVESGEAILDDKPAPSPLLEADPED